VDDSVTEHGCRGHGPLVEELRTYLAGALDQLEPVVERLHEQPETQPGPAAAACAYCPVCALIAVLRGERSELAARLAEQAAGLIAVLRTALDEGVGDPTADQWPQPDQPGTSAPSVTPRPVGVRPAARRAERSVQRIPVSRDVRPRRAPEPSHDPC
jgi:hypothetical protein